MLVNSVLGLPITGAVFALLGLTCIINKFR